MEDGTSGHQSPFFPLAVPCGSSVNVSRWAWSALVSRGGAPRQWHTYGKPNHSTMGVGLNSLFFATLRIPNYGCSFLLGTYHSKNQRQRWSRLMIHRNLLFPFLSQEEDSWLTFSLIWILWNRSRFCPRALVRFGERLVLVNVGIPSPPSGHQTDYPRFAWPMPSCWA